MKKCSKCKQTKLHACFNKNKYRRSGLSNYCKICRKDIYNKNIETLRKKSREYRRKNKEKIKIYNDLHKKEARERRLKDRYGIDLKQYNLLFKQQNGLCAICKNPESRISKNKKITILSVDHCHKTDKVRKLLCYKCNHALGLVDDDVQILKNMINYLKDYI